MFTNNMLIMDEELLADAYLLSSVLFVNPEMMKKNLRMSEFRISVTISEILGLVKLHLSLKEQK